MNDCDYQNLVRRRQQIPVPLGQLPIDGRLGILKRTWNDGLSRHVDMVLVAEEQKLVTRPFPEPVLNHEPREGDLLLCTTNEDQQLYASFDANQPGTLTEGLICGQTKSGKSYALANVIIQAPGKYKTLVVDVHKFFGQFPAIRDTHAIVRMDALHFNLFDVHAPATAELVDNMVAREICRNFGVQYGEFILSETVRTIRQQSVPTLQAVADSLADMKFQGFTKKGQYRDSALLVVNNLLGLTGELFQCSTGNDLRTLFSNNVVIELDGLHPSVQGFVISYFFEYLHILALRGWKA